MSKLTWHAAADHHAQFIGQCLRDDEADRLKSLTGQRAQLAFIGVHNGALNSAVINAGGLSVAMLCATPCRALGLRVAYLGLTPYAEGIGLFDPETMAAVRKHVQGDALGLVGSAPFDDKVQARWYQALGFRRVPDSWAKGCSIALYFSAQPGTQNLIEAFAASLDPESPAPAVH